MIAWAHPTSGVVQSCAPSLMPDLAGTIWGLSDMLARDYVVVATDYPGLGAPGMHPYLIGESEGRAVLGSAPRAISPTQAPRTAFGGAKARADMRRFIPASSPQAIRPT